MRKASIIPKLVLTVFLAGLCSLTVDVSAQRRQSSRKDKNAPKVSEPPSPTGVRVRFVDGTYLDVDEAWESPQGIWYRQGSLNHLIGKSRVKNIERGSNQPEEEVKEEDEHAPLTMTVPAPAEPAPPQSGSYDKPAWIYLVGGARVEADSAHESAAGVWYKRGPLSIFIERSRVQRVELVETENIAAAGPKERGWSTGSQKLDALIRQNGSRHGVDPYLIFLVMEQESHFNARAVSPKGARGLMQLMPGTAARFGVRRVHDPAQNISGGTRYLKQLLNRFNNRVDLVLASYNAGEGAVAKYGNRVPPYRETRNYVKRISFRYRSKKAGTKKPAASTGTTKTATAAGGR